MSNKDVDTVGVCSHTVDGSFERRLLLQCHNETKCSGTESKESAVAVNTSKCDVEQAVDDAIINENNDTMTFQPLYKRPVYVLPVVIYSLLLTAVCIAAILLYPSHPSIHITDVKLLNVTMDLLPLIQINQPINLSLQLTVQVNNPNHYSAKYEAVEIPLYRVKYNTSQQREDDFQVGLIERIYLTLLQVPGGSLSARSSTELQLTSTLHHQLVPSVTELLSQQRLVMLVWGSADVRGTVNVPVFQWTEHWRAQGECLTDVMFNVIEMNLSVAKQSCLTRLEGI